MKRRLLLGVLVWTAFITALHVTLNVGWERLAQRTRALTGDPRAELVVGFLPVT